MRRIRLLQLVVVAACVGMVSTGCFSLQKAAQVEVQVTDTSITILKPTGGLQRGGETVLKIDNYAERPVNLVLAETNASPKDLPKKLIDAVTPRDDSRIVAITSRIDKVGVKYTYGAIPGPDPKVATMHVYLKPGRRYLLFDKLGGYEHGVAIALVPPGK